MLTLRRPRPARAVVILVIAGTVTSGILAGAWYYLEDWCFFLILLLLALRRRLIGSPPIERQGRECGIDREGSNDRSDRDCGRRLRPCRRFAGGMRQGATERGVVVR